MKDAKRMLVWKRRWVLAPGEAALLGVTIGWGVAIVSAFTPPRDFSVNFLLILLLSLGPFGGISGYIFWLVCDPVREQRLRRITNIVAVLGIVVSFIAFPAFWREMERSLGPKMLLMFMGFGVAMAMYVVGTGFGVAHLAGHVAFTLRRHTKPRAASLKDGLWDSELDQG
jgi:uncharacterized membrane protein